jgi:hypothetical protein
MPINSFLYPGAKFTPAYEVANSCRFNDGDSPRCQKDLADGHDTAATISLWFKRCTNSAAQTLFECYEDSSNYFRVRLDASNEIQIRDRQGGSDQLRLKTNALIRDPSAWYSLIIIIDTTDGTAADRCKVYINGTRVTSFDTETTYGSSDTIETGNADSTVNVGGSGASDNYLDGYLAEVVFLDGVSQASSGFGEFDEDSPQIWKPKNVSGLSGSKGTNGFYLDFEDSSNLGNDVWGGTDLTEANLAATDQSSDSPTNNFCTLNPLYNAYTDPTFSEGNLKIAGSAWAGAKATMGVSTGKWYWEVKLTGTMSNHHHGVQQENVNEGSQNPQNTTGTTVFFNSDGGEMKNDGTATTADYGTLDDGDILGIALDMDAGSYGQITIYDNGSAIVSNYDLVSSSTLVMPFASIGATAEYNFGSPPYSESGGNSDGNGYGNFAASVPANHYCLNTKNLAEFG